MTSISVIDGVLRCVRYSFGPNKLHYCGPDANTELLAYINAGVSDPGLKVLIKAFRTLYPYLRFIADANHISDPFDDRVVKAYWLGNSFLDKVHKKKFHDHLIKDHGLKKILGLKEFNYITDKIRNGGVPHHSFHVLNVWRRTGHRDVPHNLESMDACRINWGKVSKVDGPFVTAMVAPIIYLNGKLNLGKPAPKKLNRQLTGNFDIENLKVGDIVTVHWHVPCEVISLRQATALKRYTLQSIKFANQTI